MKTRILFCIDFLNMTGATASLVSLLRKLDYSKYEVSLFCFTRGIAYVEQVPAEVRQLPCVPDYMMYAESLSGAVKLGLKRGWVALLVRRLVFSFGSKVTRRLDKLALARRGPVLSGEYDVAIAFCCSYMWEFICTKVTAKKRVAWLDADYRSVAELWRQFARPDEWDRVVCVCQSGAASLSAAYPALSAKTAVVHNIIDKDALLKQADEFMPDMAESCLKLVTVGRMTFAKSQDLVVKMAMELKRRGVRFVWYLIGPGEHFWRRYLEEMGNPDLSDCVAYLGGMPNPYPYMKHCDLYVQPSRSEGWGMTVTEALACGAPVLVSDIPAFREQIDGGGNGWIVPLEVSAFVGKIIEFSAGKAVLPRQGCWLSDCSRAIDFDNMIQNLDGVGS